jgi:hypothetical protein
MPLAGFEPTIPVFKRAKTFHALDRVATVTGPCVFLVSEMFSLTFLNLYDARVNDCCSFRI